MRGKSRRSTKSNEQKKYHAQVLEAREQAYCVAHRIARAWGAQLSSDEIVSAADLALCEAALRYDAKHGVKFFTYAYYFIQGAIREASTFKREFITMAAEFDEQCEQPSADVHYSSDYEEQATKFEKRDRLQVALAKLSPLAQEVVLAVDMLNVTMTALADNLGYSRGYLTEVHRKALDQLQEDLGEFALAA